MGSAIGIDNRRHFAIRRTGHRALYHCAQLCAHDSHYDLALYVSCSLVKSRLWPLSSAKRTYTAHRQNQREQLKISPHADSVTQVKQQPFNLALIVS